MRIIEYFEKNVEKYANCIAVDDTQEVLTFKELREKAISFSSKLGNSINSPVAIFLKESTEYVSAILSVIYSGNFYVPIITSYPNEMIKKILDSVNPSVIITDFENSSKLIRCGVSVSKLVIVDDESEININGVQDNYKRVLDSDPVYIMHTSGSTGIPKGVIIKHASLIDYIEWAGKTFNFNSDTVIGCKNSFAFDNSILDIFPMLFFGSRLIVLKQKESKKIDIPSLIKLMNEKKANFVFWTPSMLKYIANEKILENTKPEYLNKVLFCGEIMTNRHLNYWRRHYPEAVFANLYGPTEITDACTYYIVDREFKDDEDLPIGIPCDNTEILILNEEKQRIKQGETGEIYVRGICVAAGYWNSPERTAESFVQNPLNDKYGEIVYKTGDMATYNEYNEIMFLGRKDSQIKYFGTRVELEEIEKAAITLEGIKNACVFFAEEKNKIVMIYSAEKEIDKKSLIIAMKNKLAVFPTEYFLTDDFPCNNSGKIDRKALKIRYIKDI